MASSKPLSNHDLVKAALARSMWHAGPGNGVTKENVKKEYEKDRIEMMRKSEKVIMFLERQGVSLISMDA